MSKDKHNNKGKPSTGQPQNGKQNGPTQLNGNPSGSPQADSVGKSSSAGVQGNVPPLDDGTSANDERSQLLTLAQVFATNDKIGSEAEASREQARAQIGTNKLSLLVPPKATELGSPAQFAAGYARFFTTWLGLQQGLEVVRTSHALCGKVDADDVADLFCVQVAAACLAKGEGDKRFEPEEIIQQACKVMNEWADVLRGSTLPDVVRRCFPQNGAGVKLTSTYIDALALSSRVAAAVSSSVSHDSPMQSWSDTVLTDLLIEALSDTPFVLAAKVPVKRLVDRSGLARLISSSPLAALAFSTVHTRIKRVVSAMDLQVRSKELSDGSVTTATVIEAAVAQRLARVGASLSSAVNDLRRLQSTWALLVPGIILEEVDEYWDVVIKHPLVQRLRSDLKCFLYAQNRTNAALLNKKKASDVIPTSSALVPFPLLEQRLSELDALSNQPYMTEYIPLSVLASRTGVDIFMSATMKRAGVHLFDRVPRRPRPYTVRTVPLNTSGTLVEFDRAEYEETVLDPLWPQSAQLEVTEEIRARMVNELIDSLIAINTEVVLVLDSRVDSRTDGQSYESLTVADQALVNIVTSPRVEIRHYLQAEIDQTTGTPQFASRSKLMFATAVDRSLAGFNELDMQQRFILDQSESHWLEMYLAATGSEKDAQPPLADVVQLTEQDLIGQRFQTQLDTLVDRSWLSDIQDVVIKVNVSTPGIEPLVVDVPLTKCLLPHFDPKVKVVADPKASATVKAIWSSIFDWVDALKQLAHDDYPLEGLDEKSASAVRELMRACEYSMLIRVAESLLQLPSIDLVTELALQTFIADSGSMTTRRARMVAWRRGTRKLAVRLDAALGVLHEIYGLDTKRTSRFAQRMYERDVLTAMVLTM